jgi:hypothetical protein
MNGADLLRMRRVPLVPANAAKVLPYVAAVLGGAVFAILLGSGARFLAVGMLLAVPALVVLHRYPMAAIAVWIVVVPFVAVTESMSTRKLFWLVHRGLPAATVGVIVLGALSGVAARKLPRLGLPELMMAGSVAVALVSIVYRSNTPRESTYYLYDTVVVPMLLYLVVRLLQPSGRDLRRLVPAVIFLLVSQSVIGLISWSAPDVLPSEWLGKLGERTTGSLRSVDTYTTTIIFAGVYLLHAGLSNRPRRAWPIVLFILSMVIVFLTFSRSSWLAGAVVIVGTLVAHRAAARRLVAIALAVVVVVLGSGVLNEQIAFARARVESEQSRESALSRLPVIVAAVRMFEAKPLTGWGYESFDRYDRDFQQRVGDLVYPVKDHASHNLFLTTLAEQGLVGFVLLFGPMFVWLVRTKRRWRALPMSGFLDRRLAAALSLVLASFVIVNCFFRMQISFGFGLWWLTLGLLASLVARTDRSRHADPAGPPVHISAGAR